MDGYNRGMEKSYVYMLAFVTSSEYEIVHVLKKKYTHTKEHVLISLGPYV